MSINTSVSRCTYNPFLLNPRNMLTLSVFEILRQTKIYQVQGRDLCMSYDKILRFDIPMNKVFCMEI